MALYHCTVKKVTRAKGQSAVAKAAYNAREALLDERDGRIKDYRNAGETQFSGLFVPKDAPAWAHDRERLWNVVEETEKRTNAQLAIEIEVALPHEFTEEHRKWLVRDFVREEFSRKGFVADVNIHPPPREPEEGKQPNYHAHILVPLREIGPEGFGERGLNSGSLQENARQLEEWRERWAERGAKELRKLGYEIEADRFAVGHRTLPEQRQAALERGDLEWAEHCNREPTKHRGPAVDAMERRGVETERGQEAKKAEREAKQQRPLNQVQGEIRMTFDRAQSGTEWVAALEDRGFIVAEVREQDIHRRDCFELAALLEAKEKGIGAFAEGGVQNVLSYEAWKKNSEQAVSFKNYESYVETRLQDRLQELRGRGAVAPERGAEASAPAISAYAKAGDLAVVNERGEIYSLSGRTTGLGTLELEKYLEGVDRAALLSVTDGQKVMHQENRKPEIDREQEWCQRIEAAIERGGGIEEARKKEWLTQPYGPSEVEQLREHRKEIVGMRQEVNNELDNKELSWEHRAALREIASGLRDLHLDTSKEIATLLLEQGAYEPNVIEAGRLGLKSLAHTLEGALTEANDIIGGAVDMATNYVEELISFFDPPSLPTSELMHAGRDAAEDKAAEAEFDAKNYKEDNLYRAKIDEQDRLKREQKEREYARKQERELYPNEREMER